MTHRFYCTAPFNGLTIREDGHVRTCCVGKISLGNLNEMSIHNIEKSDTLKKIQQDMQSSVPNLENCEECLKQEHDTGLATLRQHYLRYYPIVNEEKITLKFIDIRWNNTCNLGCLYCNAGFSSTWENRLNQLKKYSPVKPYQDELLNWILERIDHVEEIMLVGGEPMLMKQNYTLLAKLPEHCKISIITNLSYELKNLPCLPDLLRRPSDKICWNVSLENTKEKFEYVRSGGAWAQIEENFSFLTQHWPENTSLNMVYSVFNAFDLPEDIDYFYRVGIKKFNLFPIGSHPTMNLTNFPKSIRDFASDKLKLVLKNHQNFIHPDDHELFPIHGLEDLLQGLENNHNKNMVTLEDFNKKINWYDQWSKRKFVDLWPDIYVMIKNELKKDSKT
jgi:MoaA/NifB/PqqE/SkfB family radical SAM enzyme